jgi:hypothetical protein
VTRYPNAVWKPLAPGNYGTGGVIRPPRGMVLHIAEGDSITGVWGWQNTGHDVSSYFIVAKDGTTWQAVDLNDKAWTQGAGNTEWIGVENCGWHTGPLTDAQVNANAGILAWLHTTYGVPLQATDDPTNGRGLGWHGMGGTAWGGHFGCPGDQIKAQRTLILERARQLVNPTPTPVEDDDMPKLVKCQNGDPMILLTNSIHSRWVQDEDELKDLTALYGPTATWAPRDFYRPVLVGPAPAAGFAGRPAGWPVR